MKSITCSIRLDKVSTCLTCQHSFIVNDLPQFLLCCGGGYSNWKVTKCQDLPKFQGGGVFWNCIKVPRSAYVSFSGGGGGVGYSETEKSQCQDLPKCSILGGGVFWNWKDTKCKDLPKCHCLRRGGILKLIRQSPKSSLNFNFSFWNWLPRSA